MTNWEGITVKRLLVLALTMAAVLLNILVPPVCAQEQAEIEVRIDGLLVQFDVYPTIKNGRTLVPFRAVANALNVAVHWDGTERTITANNGENSVWMQIDNKVAYRNDEPIPLEVPPEIIDGRTLIPLRFFGEAFDCQVAWDDSLRRVAIVSPPGEINVIGFYALGDGVTSSWTNLFGQAFPEHSTGNTDVVAEVAVGWYAVDIEGNLLTRSRTGWQRPTGWESFLATAETYGLGTEMVVHEVNRDLMLDTLLADHTAVTQMVEQITAEAVQHYTGVNLNLEGLGLNATAEELAQVQDNFTKMVTLLAESLHEQGLSLTLTLHAPNSVYKGYDYEALGQIADRIIIMAYDYGTRPEPTTLVVQAVEQALAAPVAPEKLLLGISLPSENPTSILTKVGIAKRYQLQGIALWRLGLVTDATWQALRTTVK